MKLDKTDWLLIAAIALMVFAIIMIQHNQQAALDRAVSKALDVPNCVKDVPERKRTKVAGL